jgi:hypothetical protein
VGVLLACLLIGSPAAHAAFTSTIRAGILTFNTFQLATPTGFTVTPTCTANGAGSGKYRISVKVTGAGPPKATHYVLTVSDDTGVRFTSDLAPGATTTFAPSSGQPSGNWSYTIRSEYRVSATGVVWKSSSPPITNPC